MPLGTPPGSAAALKYRSMLHKTFPYLRVKIEKGDRASWTGTHRGLLPIMTLPVTNRAFAFTGMVFWRIGDGKIVER
jgi:predicted ester cyclase